MHWLAERFELSRGGDAQNVRPMEGLRGFAVFLVFLVHYVSLVKPWIDRESAIHGVADALHTIGNVGVDLFFVLSGYLIYGSLIGRPQPFLRFMARRVERIYPAFVVVFAIYCALSLAFPAESRIPLDTGDAVLYLTQNLLLLPGLFPIPPMITVAWSLSYEMFYYLVIPLVIGAFRLRTRSPVWRIALFLAATLFFAAYCAVMAGPVRLLMFVAGMILFESRDNARVPTPSGRWALAALVAGLLAMLLPPGGSPVFVLKVGILFIAFLILCLACFREPLSPLARAFSWTPLRWLGNMSYSYYLLHGLALKAGFLALSKLLPGGGLGSGAFWMLLPPMFILTLVPTTLLFLQVERPWSLVPRRTRAALRSGKGSRG